MDDRHLEMFREELLTLVGSLEAGLLELEERPTQGKIDEVFRFTHNVKSAAAMIDLAEVSTTAHAMESVLDAARCGEVALTAARLSALLASVDLLRHLIQGGRMEADHQTVLDRLFEAPEVSAPVPPPEPRRERTVAIGLQLDPGVLARGLDPLRLLAAAAELGEVVSARVDPRGLPPLEALDPERVYVAHALELRTTASLDELRSVFLFAEGSGEVRIEELGAAEAVAAAEGDEGGAGQPSEIRTGTGGLDTLVVGVRRVDQLVDLSAELLVAASRLEHVREEEHGSQDSRLKAASEEILRLAERVQEAAMSIRLVPLAPTFMTLRRYVRDQSLRLGKDVEVRIDGAQVEIDKSVAELLADPLKHLVRNALDHGIEKPEERQQAGKPARGRLELVAREVEGQLQVDVRDDGRGVEVARVLQIAAERGLLAAGEEPHPDQALELIFLPGFTTSAEVGELSGRGVGLDVVRRNIADLGGDLRVTSTPGQGTCFRICVPLTLAVVQAMVVRCADQRLAIPLDVVRALAQPQPGDLARLPDGQELLRLGGGEVPLLRLGQVLGFGDRLADRPVAVVAQAGNRRLALLVDEIVAQEPVLLKPLNHRLRFHDGVLGAAILGDGHVALVLELAHLAERGRRPDSTSDLSPNAAPSPRST